MSYAEGLAAGIYAIARQNEEARRTAEANKARADERAEDAKIRADEQAVATKSADDRQATERNTTLVRDESKAFDDTMNSIANPEAYALARRRISFDPLKPSKWRDDYKSLIAETAVTPAVYATKPVPQPSVGTPLMPTAPQAAVPNQGVDLPGALDWSKSDQANPLDNYNMPAQTDATSTSPAVATLANAVKEYALSQGKTDVDLSTPSEPTAFDKLYNAGMPEEKFMVSPETTNPAFDSTTIQQANAKNSRDRTGNMAAKDLSKQLNDLLSDIASGKRQPDEIAQQQANIITGNLKDLGFDTPDIEVSKVPISRIAESGLNSAEIKDTLNTTKIKDTEAGIKLKEAKAKEIYEVKIPGGKATIKLTGEQILTDQANRKNAAQKLRFEGQRINLSEQEIQRKIAEAGYKRGQSETQSLRRNDTALDAVIARDIAVISNVNTPEDAVLIAKSHARGVYLQKSPKTIINDLAANSPEISKLIQKARQAGYSDSKIMSDGAFAGKPISEHIGSLLSKRGL